MSPRTTSAVLSPIAVMLLSGCLGTGEDRVLSIESTGTVEGLVYLDVNGNGSLDAQDQAFPGAVVGLAAAGSQFPIFSTATDDDGLFRIVRVDVATYEVVIDPESIGDSLDVVATDPDLLTLSPGDTTAITVAVSYPAATVEEARQLPEGEKVFVLGIALNDIGAFGDNSVHLAGASAAIRVTGLRNSVVFGGDSIRVIGTTATALGQPTLDESRAFVIRILEVPPPDTATAAVAATADGGTLDAALVFVSGVTVVDTTTVSEGFQLTVEDASGALLVLLDKDAPISDPESYEPGFVIDATGLLVPNGAGNWILKPRESADLVTVSAP